MKINIQKIKEKNKSREDSSSGIVRNSVITPDGTELVSRSRHDYVTYKDKNGFEYSVDGGLSYFKRGKTYQAPAPLDNSLTLDSPFSQIRKIVEWGTYGKEGKSPLKMIKIKDISNDHLINILKDFYEDKNPICYQYVEIFIREFEYRKLA